MSFATIRAQIVNKLNTLVPATLKAVLDGEQDQQKVDIAAFPIVEVRRSGNEGDYLTNQEDIQAYAFELWVYAEASNQDYAAAEKSLDSVLDTIISTFKTDRYLAGTAEGGVDPVPTGNYHTEWRGKPVYAAVVTLRCRKIIT
jgi:hypothetical protein